MTIAALVSGGVDSSVTIPVLKDMGYTPDIFYIKIALEGEPGFMDCPSEEDIEITSYIAKKYGCRMEVVDLQEEYRDRVIDYTLQTVRKGLTPNPDMMCNRLIKFGSFNSKFGKDYDRISTGHYATHVEKEGQLWLGTARDRKKDQTYFLGRITYEQLSKAMFPIGHMQKSEVRDKAAALKLPSAERPDSQGICFLGKINYTQFIKKYTGEKPGRIVELETGRILGEHRGIWFHTIGQRKGLGLGQGPWFVVGKDTAENTLFVSNGYDPASQYKKEIELEDFSFINPGYDEKVPPEQEINFKIRHQPEFTPGMLIRRSQTHFTVQPLQPVSGVAPGQFGVIYDEDKTLCLGSGVIT
ncbi:MAG: tRNA 2-thiouridine(34) synthase MnmA [Bacteroidales bacterium]